MPSSTVVSGRWSRSPWLYIRQTQAPTWRSIRSCSFECLRHAAREGETSPSPSKETETGTEAEREDPTSGDRLLKRTHLKDRNDLRCVWVGGRVGIGRFHRLGSRAPCSSPPPPPHKHRPDDDLMVVCPDAVGASEGCAQSKAGVKSQEGLVEK